jgi:hypothetical protein
MYYCDYLHNGTDNVKMKPLTFQVFRYETEDLNQKFRCGLPQSVLCPKCPKHRHILTKGHS